MEEFNGPIIFSSSVQFEFGPLVQECAVERNGFVVVFLLL